MAGIAGYVAGKNSDAKAQITDCHSKVSITVTGIRTLDAGVAGVAGYSTNAKITNCSNEATVEIVSAGRGGLTYYAGGIDGVARTGCQIEACTIRNGLVCTCGRRTDRWYSDIGYILSLQL